MLLHTLADAILNVRINGASHGEIGINTLLAGSYGPPVGLAGGGEAACEERLPRARPGDTVARRQPASPPARRPAGPPASVPRPLRIEVDPHQPRAAEPAALMPGVTRSGRAVALDAETMTAAHGMLHLMVALTQNGP